MHLVRWINPFRSRIRSSLQLWIRSFENFEYIHLKMNKIIFMCNKIIWNLWYIFIQNVNKFILKSTNLMVRMLGFSVFTPKYGLFKVVALTATLHMSNLCVNKCAYSSMNWIGCYGAYILSLFAKFVTRRTVFEIKWPQDKVTDTN